MGVVTRALAGLGDVLGERRALHPSQGEEWRGVFGAGVESYAGVDVTVEGALALPAMWACAKVLAESTAMLPLIVYRREGEGRTRATDHAVYELLHGAPNPEQTSMEFREMTMLHLASWGNAYAEIEVDGGGRVRALWPLLPGNMVEVKRREGRLRYHYRLPSGEMRWLDESQVLHQRGLSGDGLLGYSPVRVAMQAIGLGLAAEEYGARFFGSGARPDLVLMHPGKLSEEAVARLKRGWQREHQGLRQAHRLRVLEEGMQLEKVGTPPQEAQFLETRRFQALDVARMFRMPPHKIGLLDQATFSNIEHQSIEFVTDTLMPWLVRMEQRYALELLSERERRSMYVEHLTDALVRGDILTRYRAYAMGRQWGWLSINDVRQRENMDPIAEGDGYLSPLNMVPVGSEEQGEGAGVRAAWLRQEAARVVRREAADLRRAAGRLRRGPEEWGAYVEELYRGLLPGMVEGLAGVGVDERRVRDVAAGYVMRHGALVAGVAGDEDAGAALEEVVAGLEREGVGELMAGLLGRGM